MKKKAILSSILTIALCLSMIAGSSFALFTSKSDVNVAVTSGKVKVVATVGEIGYTSTLGNKLTESSATAEGNTITISKMVPGDKITFPITIHNESDVTVNYRTVFAMVEDTGLWEALVITVAESAPTEDAPAIMTLGLDDATATDATATDAVATPAGTMLPGCADITLDVTITLPETAGNEYQEKGCSFAYTVEAIQGNANFTDIPVAPSSLESLNAAINSGATNIRFDSDMTIDVAQNDDYSAIKVNKDSGAADTVTLNGTGTVTSSFFVIWAKAGSKVIVNSGTYKSTGTSHLVYVNAGSIVEINGGTFIAPSIGDHMFNMSNTSPYGSIIIKGGTFSRDPSTWWASGDRWNEAGQYGIKIEDGYKVVEIDIDGTTWWRVVEDTEKVVSIRTKADLLAFANDVISNGNTYAGKIVRLKADIDLAGVAWQPIMNSDLYHNFAGTFDGNGHTIKNMTVNAGEYAGFFGKTINATIKDVTFENAAVTGNHYAGVVVAWVSDGCPNVRIDNCHVKNSTVTLAAEQIGDAWDNGDKAGAIVGFVGAGSISYGIRNCTVSDTTVKGYRDIGGIVGYAGTNVKNCAVTRVTVIIDKTHDYKNYGSDDAKYDAGSFGGEFVDAYAATDCVGNATIQYDA